MRRGIKNIQNHGQISNTKTPREKSMGQHACLVLPNTGHVGQHTPFPSQYALPTNTPFPLKTWDEHVWIMLYLVNTP